MNVFLLCVVSRQKTNVALQLAAVVWDRTRSEAMPMHIS